MKKFYLALVLCIATGVAVAQSQEMIPLWTTGKMPNSKGLNLPDSVVEKYLYHVGQPRLYAYLASKELNTGAAVLIVPGGGYIRLPASYDNVATAKFFQSKGINAFVLCHRLPTSRDLVTRQLAPLQDAQRAMRIVYANAERWGIDVKRVGVNGTSAGGHVSATLGTQQEDVSAVGDELDKYPYKPAFMILISGVLSMDDAVTHKVSRRSLLGGNPSPELVKEYSNENRVTSATPPALLIHADNDRTVSPINSARFYQAMKQAGVSSSLHIFPQGGHGINVSNNPGSTQMWTELCMEWLKEMKFINGQ